MIKRTLRENVKSLQRCQLIGWFQINRTHHLSYQVKDVVSIMESSFYYLIWWYQNELMLRKRYLISGFMSFSRKYSMPMMHVRTMNWFNLKLAISITNEVNILICISCYCKQECFVVRKTRKVLMYMCCSSNPFKPYNDLTCWCFDNNKCAWRNKFRYIFLLIYKLPVQRTVFDKT